MDTRQEEDTLTIKLTLLQNESIWAYIYLYHEGNLIVWQVTYSLLIHKFFLFRSTNTYTH